MVCLVDVFEKVKLKKNCRGPKKLRKLPSMQRVKAQITTSADIIFCDHLKGSKSRHFEMQLGPVSFCNYFYHMMLPLGVNNAMQ